MSVEITDIKVFPVKGASKFKANGVFTIAGGISINFKVIEGSKGNFVSFPQESYEDKNTKEKKYKNLVNFASDEDRNDVSSRLLAAYNKYSGGANRGEESQVVPESTGNKPAVTSRAKNLPF